MSAAYTVSFDHEFHYRELPGLGVRPALAVGIIGPAGQQDTIAIIDSAAEYSLFNGVRARPIGLDLETGRQIRLGSLGGGLDARLFRITLEILGSRFDCEVAFSEQHISRELLGMNELFDRIRLGLCGGSSLGYFHPRA